MTIFDELIQKTYDLLPQGGKSTAALPDPASHQGKKSELILGKETAFELGGRQRPLHLLHHVHRKRRPGAPG